MNDARRFLRFVLPGLVFFLELVAMLWVSGRTLVYQMFSSNSDGAVAVLGVLIASGGIGYMFSLPYFGLMPHLDYRPVLIPLQRWTRIKIVHECGQHYSLDDLVAMDRLQALIIVNQLWTYAEGNSKGVATIKRYTQNANDIMTGVGITISCSMGALFVWIVLINTCGYVAFRMVALVGWLVLVLSLIINYLRLRKMVTNFANSSLLSVLRSSTKYVLLKQTVLICKGGIFSKIANIFKSCLQ